MLADIVAHVSHQNLLEEARRLHIYCFQLPEVYISGSFIIFVAGLSSSRSQSSLAILFQSLRIKATIHH